MIMIIVFVRLSNELWDLCLSHPMSEIFWTKKHTKLNSVNLLNIFYCCFSSRGLIYPSTFFVLKTMRSVIMAEMIVRPPTSPTTTKIQVVYLSVVFLLILKC